MDERYYKAMNDELKTKSKLPQSTGIMFIRWNYFNRIIVGVAYFEKGKMVFMKLDKDKMLKICLDFLPKEVSYDFILDYPIAMKKQKISEDAWNDMAIQQNGILEIHKTYPVASKLDKRRFNKYANIFLQ